MHAKRMTIMLVLTGIILFLLFGYKAMVNHFINDFLDNMSAPTVSITESQVSEIEWEDYYRTIGTFKAKQGAQLTAQASGVLQKIHFENGQAVKKGDLLFELDTEVDVAERNRLVAVLENAKHELRRIQPLVKQKNVSEADLERAENQVAQAKAALSAQDALIAYKNPRAPFDGVVGIRKVNLGQYISVGTELVSLTSFDPIYLQFNVVEQRLSDIQVGMDIFAIADAYQKARFKGKVTAIEPNIRESTRTVEIQAEFENAEQLLRPGMFARIELPTSAPKMVQVIPKTAVQFNPFGNLVFVIQEAEGELTVSQKLIRTGTEIGDLVEVVAGLELGERVASSGLLKLRNGSVVKINDDPALQPSQETNPTPVNQ